MTKQQAAHWASRFRQHPPIAEAKWIGYDDGSFGVVVHDRLGNSEEFDDTCHASTTLHIWREQYDTAVRHR